MNRFKQWIKRKLGITALRKEVIMLNSRMDVVMAELLTAQSVIKFIEVGVDFHPSGCGSWAVICAGGKRDYVRFVDLSGHDVKKLRRFLGSFQPENIKIDTLNPDVFDLMRGLKK